MLDSGVPPPDPVPIECTCNGRSRIETYTDTKGLFSFRLGQNEASVQDASVDLTVARIGGLAGSQVDCQVSARLPGYRSDAFDISNRHSSDSPNIGTLVLHALSRGAGNSISLTSLRAPEKARKAYQDAMKFAGQGKMAKARQLLEKAVKVYPEYASAWCELGLLQQSANQDEDARRSFAQSVAADPNFVRPYLLFSVLAWKHNAWQIMADSSARAVHLDPAGYPQAYIVNSVASLQLRRLEEAEKSALAALKADPQHQYPRAYYVLGTILAAKKDSPGAIAALEHYLEYAPHASDATTVRARITELAAGKY
jgi:tetratricopeptide (TPR) repeat protein